MPPVPLTTSLIGRIYREAGEIAAAHPQRRRVPRHSEGEAAGTAHYSEGLTLYLRDRILPGLRPHFPNVDQQSLSVLSLMAILGPRHAGLPPGALFAEAREHLLSYLDAAKTPEEEQPDAATQILLAYACRWRRIAASGPAEWNEIWPNGVFELASIAHNFTIQACGILARSVRGFSYPQEETLKTYANLTCMAFIRRGEPQRYAYQNYQRLERWMPERGNLYGWLQRAIQGSPPDDDRFRANTFRHGLLCPLLEEDQGLFVRKVAFWKCARCGRQIELRSTDQPACRCDAAAEMKIISVDRLILRDRYERIPFRRLMEGDGHPHYLPIHHENTPRGIRLSRRKSYLHVPAAAVRG